MSRVHARATRETRVKKQRRSLEGSSFMASETSCERTREGVAKPRGAEGPAALADNTLLDLRNSSNDTQPHSIIVNS